MERVLSVDEKIRRAEELYARRLQNGTRRVATVNVEGRTKKNSYVKKMCKQCVICLIIYILFYSIKNSDEILPKNIIDKINEILQYDINMELLQGKIDNYIIEMNEKSNTNLEDNNEFVNELAEEIPDVNEINNETPEETNLTEQEIIQENNTLDPMQENAEYIKANYSFIKPVEAQVTSRFGLRENVEPKNHTGIDLAEDTGTVIVAAMEGTVELVSGTGNYGNHVKITNGEVSTLYAHCKTIYVKEGDTVKQGQEIAEIGATGNATGPHVHFEILRNGEYVDPDLVIQF